MKKKSSVGNGGQGVTSFLYKRNAGDGTNRHAHTERDTTDIAPYRLNWPWG